MTVLVQDDFNRADSTTIGPGQLGPAPTEFGGNSSIASNKLQGPTSTTGGVLWDVGVGEAQVQVVASSSNTNLILRAPATGNDGFVLLQGNRIYKRTGGGNSQVAVGGPASTQPGDTIAFKAMGNVYTGYVNGVAQVTYTDAGNNYLTNTRHGVYWTFTSPASTADDLLITASGGGAHGTTTLDATAILAATGRKVAHGSASTVATSTLTGSGHKAGRGTTLLTSPAGLTASGHAVGAAHGTATLTLNGVLTATGHKNGHGTAALSSPGTLTASGHAVAERRGQTELTLTATLTGTGRKLAHGTTALTLTATLTARGFNPANRHDITVTATLEPRRWAGALARRDKTGTLPARRWTGALT